MKLRRPGWSAVLLVLSLLFGIGLAAANAVLGPLNQDEGLYLQCSRCVAHGLEPYRDFFFPQAPALLYFYALFQRVWFHPGSALGVLLSARLLTALLGLAASALAALAAFRIVRDSPSDDNASNLRAARLAALVTWLCTACSPAHSYFSTIVKTYALTDFFLALGMLLLVLMQRRNGPLGRSPFAFDAGIFLGLAAVTRLSFAFVLPPTCLCLWLAAPKDRRRAGFRDAVFVAIGALLVIGVSLGRSLVLCPENLRAGLSVHGARDIAGLFSWLSLRAGFLSRTFQAYPLLWCLAVLAIPFARRASFAGREVVWAMGTSVLAVTLLHFLTPFPYDDYQTPIMPIFAIVVSALLARSLSQSSTQKPSSFLLRPSYFLLLLSGILALSSPLLMDWVVLRQDRFWFEMKRRPDVLILRDAGRRVRALADALPEEDPARSYLLTQDAYLAAESGLAVPRGLELGPFTLCPDLPDDEARRLRALNPERARALLAGRYPLAATSGYTFAIAYPDGSRVDETLRQSLLDEIPLRYEPVETIPDFGQAHTPLTIWRRRDPQ